MKRSLLIVLTLFTSAVMYAGTDSDAVAPGRVRSETLLSMARWAKHPTDATGCGGSDCCVAPATDGQCTTFAKNKIDKNPLFWAPRVEEWYTRSTSANWECNQWVPNRRPDPVTFCGAWPATQTVRDSDVAIALSELAAVEE